MKGSWRTIGLTISSLAAIALAVAPSGSALAGEPLEGTLQSGPPVGVVASGATVHVLANRQESDVGDGSSTVIYLRGRRAGTTWDPPRPIARGMDDWGGPGTVVSALSIGASGQHVFAAYAKEWRKPCGDRTCTTRRILGRASDDAGDHWQPAVVLPIGYPMTLSVAFAGDALLVAWTDRESGVVAVVRSTDGGVTFGPRQAIGTTGTCHGRCDGHPTIAASGDMVTVLWHREIAPYTVLARRSRDAGARFEPRLTISREGPAGALMASASSDSLAVAFASDNSIHVARVEGRTVTDEVLPAVDGEDTIEPGDVLQTPDGTLLSVTRHRGSWPNEESEIGTVSRTASDPVWTAFEPLRWTPEPLPGINAYRPLVESTRGRLIVLFLRLVEVELDWSQVRWLRVPLRIGP